MGLALINWKVYNNALVQRGDFTIYIYLQTLKGNGSPARGGRKREEDHFYTAISLSS